MNELQDKIAVITGAAGGIGAATALAFAAEGAAAVVVADVNEAAACAVVKKVAAAGSCACRFVKTDISDPRGIEALFRTLKADFPRLDILVNCAGICPVAPPEEITIEGWDRVMAINLRGTFLCCREALGIMKGQRGGAIVNVSSVSGRIGGIATGVDYAASKGGIISLTMSLAKTGGPHGINVNAVAPGFIHTEMTKDFTHFDPAAVPLRRIGEPEDVADVIVFLASRKARYITGQTIDINGGVYMT
ncbi:MAG: SDR family NAD(P)-dependent oxidoreductase [Spirochaetia bacterium]|jgi:3-oxoacyl-[acyl-carrier protein] reductase